VKHVVLGAEIIGIVALVSMQVRAQFRMREAEQVAAPPPNAAVASKTTT
jgi:hypothetical protein